ncbi:dGTP triphosphohydrolase [Massilia endophytica]|uniref:dGTP triphosphohydrolase n=1 Tax=Massilia endophytica TaxID=2899220 RepID=UPI001E57DC44|nr:dNTP triphosphohydrolase [Massilia endophytica]UGQ44733.1 dNTP triphosphohydrolase [Massilia endophytica]
MYSNDTIDFARQQEALVLPLEYRVHAQADGRSVGREECMRDYARVLYSASFRRLQGKMQLLGVDANRFNRNRLTHSLEVAQIARSIAADLGLERSVVSETCSLAHDIGNPPFGHYGEKILNELGMEHGGFEGNAQAFRILRTLEKKHHAYAGLNLTVRSLFGITKYFHLRADNPKKFLYDEDHAFLKQELGRHGIAVRKSIDAQIMDLADEIAYAAHDVEDALSFGIITWGEILHEFKISKEFAEAFEPFSRIAHDAHEEALKCEMQASSEEYSIVLRKELTSQIVHDLCRDIAVVDGKNGPELGYRSMALLAKGLKTLLWKAILRKKDVQLYEKRGEKIIRGLFEVLTDTRYNRDNILLPPELRCLKDSRERLVIDYISGMMDSYAAQEYEKYFGKGSLDAIY